MKLIKTEPTVFAGCKQATYQEAYASLDRLEGKCDLLLIYHAKNRRKRKEPEVYRLTLCFDHEGIREHRIKTLYWFKQGTETNRFEYRPLSITEAAALLQDAYLQNQRFNTPAAEGYSRHAALLECDIPDIQRRELLRRLSNQRLSSRMLVNVYLAALRRMDNALLYDLSSPKRQECLGGRREFILKYGEEYREIIFIRSGISRMKKEGDTLLTDVFALVITPQEEIMRVSYHLRLISVDGEYCIDDFTETGREILQGDHPENPFNYKVHCFVYDLEIQAADAIRDWLDFDEELFLTGELENALIYKWLKRQDKPWEEYNLYDSIFGEFILSEKQLIVYARKPANLVESARKVTRHFLEYITGHRRMYLPVRTLYQAVFSRPSDTIGKGNNLLLHKYQGYSALLYTNDYYPLIGYLNRNTCGKIMLGPRTWCFFRTKKSFKEYYLSGNWLKIYCSGDELEREIEFFRTNFLIKDMVLDQELEDYFDLFNPPVSEQKKWHIYGLLCKFYKEKGEMQELGLVPPLRNVVKTMGGIKTGASG